jgi:hypothetical protein
MNESELGYPWDIASHPDTDEDVVFIDSENTVSLTRSDLIAMMEELS